MKNVVLSTILVLGSFATAHAADMTIYYSPTCPHCHHAQDYTKNNLIYEYPNMNVTTVDVTKPEHRSLFIDVLKTCEFSSGGVPVIKIGDKCFQGFGESMADELRAAIEVDMNATAKKSAADVRSALANKGDAYRAEHKALLKNVSEYVAPVENNDAKNADENADENADKTAGAASDNKLASWVLAIFALLVLGFSVSFGYRKRTK